MSYRYRIHELAHDEYISAYEWYEIKQIGLGDRFMKSVELRLVQISEHPEYFSKKHSNYRIAKVENFPYYIVYEFFKRKSFIHIAAIYHGKRNPKNRFRKI